MKVKFVQKAPPGVVFDPGMMAAQVGKTVPVRSSEGTAKVVGAVVSEDGSEVELTLELSEGLITPAKSAGSFSIAPTED